MASKGQIFKKYNPKTINMIIMNIKKLVYHLANYQRNMIFLQKRLITGFTNIIIRIDFWD